MVTRMYQWICKTFAQLCRCVVCDEPAATHNLCQLCANTLPVAGFACARCALPLPHQDARCGACLLNTPAWDNAASAFAYRFPVDLLLTRTKFNARLDMAHALGHATALCFAAGHPVRADAIVPVPLHWGRRWRRGFNQAAVLAEPVAARLQLPMRQRVLRRRKPTSKQSRLDAGARQANVNDAFDVIGNVRNQRLILFDDVMTTGATLGAAAQALQQAGASHVRVWTCARVAPPKAPTGS